MMINWSVVPQVNHLHFCLFQEPNSSLPFSFKYEEEEKTNMLQKEVMQPL